MVNSRPQDRPGRHQHVHRISQLSSKPRTSRVHDDDLVPGGSDRLIDRVVAWGVLYDAHGRIDQHTAAGADEVALHVLTERPGLPRTQWTELASSAPEDRRRDGYERAWLFH